MPKIAYIEKTFRDDKLELIGIANGIVAEYEAQGYGLTLRQLYYQMVSRDIIPNNIRSYKNLGNLIDDARSAGLVDWHAIEDRTRNLRRRPHWEEPQEIIDAIARQHHIDYWEGQENYVEAWVEKDALIGIVEQIGDKLDVACFSCRGYTSQSELWGSGHAPEAALRRWAARGAAAPRRPRPQRQGHEPRHRGALGAVRCRRR